MSDVDSPAYIHSLCTDPRLTYILCSLGFNAIGDEGASALAAILNETMISTLKYTAPPPDLTLSLAIFILLLARTGSGAIKSEPRAPLRLPISFTRQISPTWSARPPTKCLLYFSTVPLDTRLILSLYPPCFSLGGNKSYIHQPRQLLRQRCVRRAQAR